MRDTDSQNDETEIYRVISSGESLSIEPLQRLPSLWVKQWRHACMCASSTTHGQWKAFCDLSEGTVWACKGFRWKAELEPHNYWFKSNQRVKYSCKCRYLPDCWTKSPRLQNAKMKMLATLELFFLGGGELQQKMIKKNMTARGENPRDFPGAYKCENGSCKPIKTHNRHNPIHRKRYH